MPKELNRKEFENLLKEVKTQKKPKAKEIKTTQSFTVVYTHPNIKFDLIDSRSHL